MKDSLRALRRDIDLRVAMFGEPQLEWLDAALTTLAEASIAEAKAEHVAQARRVKAGEVCPRCGGELMRRKGRYGEFMGCSNYPRCRYTRSL